MATMNIQEIFATTGEKIGFYEFLLPWLLFFAIIFGLLERLDIFKGIKGARQLNTIIAVTLAFFVTRFVPGVSSIGAILTALFGQGALVLSGMLLILLFLGLIGLDIPGEKLLSGKIGKFIILLLVVIGIIIFAASGALAAIGIVLGLPTTTFQAGRMEISWDVILTIGMIAIILAAIIWLGKGEGGGKKEEVKKALEEMAEEEAAKRAGRKS